MFTFASKFGKGATFEVKRSADGYVAVKASFGSLRQKKSREVLEMLGEVAEGLKIEPTPVFPATTRSFNFSPAKAPEKVDRQFAYWDI